MNYHRTSRRTLRPGCLQDGPLLATLIVGLLSFSAMADGTPPPWWQTQEVTAGGWVDDYAVANMGQLKTIAAKAAAEMIARRGSAGVEIGAMTRNWSTSGQDYLAVTVGEVKSVAQMFYDRLGLQPPWTATTADDDNFALANIGQVKTAFAFPIAAIERVPVSISTSTVSAATKTTSYSFQIAASGGFGALRYSATGLPPGLYIGTYTGLISGTPTGFGPYLVNITVRDSWELNPTTTTMQVQMQVSSTSNLTLPASSFSQGGTNIPYSASVAAAYGMTPYTYSMSSGTLPSGLVLSSNGTISGTPTTAGTSSFSISVTDSNSPHKTATQSYQLTIYNSDADADGIMDSWEQQIVNASSTDAITSVNDVLPMDDFDQDRIPNLWEYKRQTSPVDAASTPSMDLVLANGQSIQTGYTALPAGGYYAIVRVQSGAHPAPLSASLPAKNVLWLGDLGATTSGEEGARLVFQPNSNGIFLSGLCVMNGLILDGDRNSNLSGSALQVQANTKLYMRNCMIRYCTVGGGNGAMWLYQGSVVDLLHVTIHGCRGGIVGNSFPPAINNNAGTLSLTNCCVWDGRSNKYYNSISTAAAASTTIRTSLVQGIPGVAGVINEDPQTVGASGWLTSDSTACFGAGTPGLLSVDIHGQSRPATSADLGAEQWVNSDAGAGEHLPDWWERWWFGSLIANDGGDEDADALNDLLEYLNWTPPLAYHSGDADGDGLPDNWEIQYWGQIQSQDGSGNPDDDERNNAAEFAAHTDPTKMDPDSDKDHDGLWDVWELQYWQPITAQNASGNPDQDGRNNAAEMLAGTNPIVMDADYDGDSDGLMDVWEIRWWGNVTSQNATDNPDGDFLQNIEEQKYNTNPTVADQMTGDRDMDGWPDAWEVLMFGSLQENYQSDFDGNGVTIGQELGAMSTFATRMGWDPESDADHDTFTLLQELMLGTDPAKADTDNDGVNDNLDLMPLDPLVGATPADVPGPPVVNLLSPFGASLLP